MSLFSVNTNLGALAALQALDSNQQDLTAAQNQVSTGKKVSSAADNPAVYSIANTLNSNIAGLSAVSDSLNFGAQIIATATSGITNVQTQLQNLQTTVTSSGTNSYDLPTLQAAVDTTLASINQYAKGATFSGVNLLTSSADSGATNASLNVVQSLDGSAYSVANQATTLNSSATTLTDALGLTGLSVLGGTTGVKLAFDNNLSAASFSPSGADASLQLTTGTGSTAKTYAFEFTDDSLTTPTPLQTAQNATTQIVAVHFNSTTQSTNQIVGNLITAVRNTGFGVVQNTDGSLNVTGSSVASAAFGSVAAGAFTASTTTGVTSTALTGTQALISQVQSAITSANSISANLGAASQQLTGIQNFTTSLSSALTAGVGALTDADLAAESARLTSLQTKQQLATQSLSIANKQPQSLLTLFQGL